MGKGCPNWPVLCLWQLGMLQLAQVWLRLIKSSKTTSLDFFIPLCLFRLFRVLSFSAAFFFYSKPLAISTSHWLSLHLVPASALSNGVVPCNIDHILLKFPDSLVNSVLVSLLYYVIMMPGFSIKRLFVYFEKKPESRLFSLIWLQLLQNCWQRCN